MKMDFERPGGKGGEGIMGFHEFFNAVCDCDDRVGK